MIWIIRNKQKISKQTWCWARRVERVLPERHGGARKQASRAQRGDRRDYLLGIGSRSRPQLKSFQCTCCYNSIGWDTFQIRISWGRRGRLWSSRRPRRVSEAAFPNRVPIHHKRAMPYTQQSQGNSLRSGSERTGEITTGKEDGGVYEKRGLKSRWE